MTDASIATHVPTALATAPPRLRPASLTGCSAAACLAVALMAGTPGLAFAVTCAVPGNAPTLAAAVANPICNPIVLAADTYPGSITVSRDVTIIGAGSGTTLILGSPGLAAVTAASPATVRLRQLGVLLYPGTTGVPALGKAPGASISLGDVRIGQAAPFPSSPILNDAVALWRFADTTDSNGGESDFFAVGNFTVGNPVSIFEPAVVNANGFAANEGAVNDCFGFGERFVDAAHELALTANGSMTMWARVRFGAFDGVDDVFRLGHGGFADRSTWELDFVNGQARFAVTGLGQAGETRVLGQQVLATQTWYDLTGVFDAQAGQIRLYVHDVSSGQAVGTVSTQAVAFSSLDLGDSTNLLFLEAPQNNNGCNQGAQLETAAVWNRALSSAEISALSLDDQVFANGFE